MVNHFGQCLRCAGTLAFAKQQIRMYMCVCTTNVNMSTMKIETIRGIIVWLTNFKNICSVPFLAMACAAKPEALLCSA